MELNAEQIEKILPHRYPFLMIDRVTDCEPGLYAKGRKCVTVNEPFFQGHFPDEKIMPGVLILEVIAQTSAVLILSEPENHGRAVLLGGIRNARFKRQVHPGDVLETVCKLTNRMGHACIVDAEAWVDGQIVARAELSVALSDGPDGIRKR